MKHSNLYILKLLICFFIISLYLNILVLGESNVTKILNDILNNGYDKRVRPNYGGPPVEVGVTVHFIAVHSLSETNMDFTASFYFRQLWEDPRLAFKSSVGPNYILAKEVADSIWIPDTFFANEKSAYFHTTTVPNTFLRISSSGEVYRSLRLTITASCPMNLQYFPMDNQLCTLEIESYGYSSSDIAYKWGKGFHNSVGLSHGLELPQFKIIRHKAMQKYEILSTGNYTRLVVEILFKRGVGYYMIQFYIPAILIVVMSWTSFWLSRDSRTERVIIGVTTTLAIIGLIHSVQTIMPKISYIKAIDVYLGFCFLMVFGSLLVYLTINYLSKRAFNKNTKQQMSEAVSNQIQLKLINRENESDDENKENRFFNFGFHNKLHGYRVDCFSRILFPTTFLVMNLIYWTYYLNPSEFIVEDLITNY